MLTLTYGHKKPGAGDKGSIFFPALEDNIDIDDAHNHDGVTSPKVNASSITASVVDVSGSGWTPDGTFYKKQVTFPGAHTRLESLFMVYFEGGTHAGEICTPKVEYVSDTVFWMYAPVGTQAFKVVFK